MAASQERVAEFIVAACVPIEAGHKSGTLGPADAMLAACPDIATSNIYTAAILGDEVTVRQFLGSDRDSSTAKGGPHGWDPLTYLCFSNYLRLDPSRSAGFVRTAKALLAAGARATTGFYSNTHQPEPEFESAIYGAAGVAHHPELARLLIDHGADPNDGEVTYHAPETHDTAVLKVLLESRKLTADSLATMLLRKCDWHDLDGIKLLLEHGADPNRVTPWGFTALHQAVRRDNAFKIAELMLDHEASPALLTDETSRNNSQSMSAMAIAARRGRADLLQLFERRSLGLDLQGIERLIAACAKDDAAGIRRIADREPRLVAQLVAEGGKLLAEFAGNGNTKGVGQLLDIGVDVNALFHQGDGYWGIANDSTALHVASWRACHETVKFLIARGAQINALDGRGRTPLELAVRACVDSHWTERRSPESVQALLEAGASPKGVLFPSGYSAVDDLLKQRGAAT